MKLSSSEVNDSRRSYGQRMTLVLMCLVLMQTSSVPSQTQSSASVDARKANRDAVASLPAGGQLLLGADPWTRLKLSESSAAQAEVTTVNVSGQPFAKALRVRTKARTKSENAVALTLNTAHPITDNDTLFIRFWARLVQTEDEGGEGRIRIALENVTPQSPAAFYPPKQASIKEAWERFDFPVPARLSLGRGQARFVLGFGNTAPQTIELGGLEVLNFGNKVRADQLPFNRQTYEGREPDAAWRKAAAHRIEKYRKGDLQIRVTDAAGNPMSGASVQVRMTRHAYVFGSEYNPKFIVGNTPDAAKHREWIPKLFNQAVPGNGLKWMAWEDPAQRADTLQSIKWLRERGVQVRGHTLLWPSWRRTPKSVKKLYEETLSREGKDAAKTALQKRVMDHIRDEVSTTKGVITEWDVINEPFGNHDLMDIIGEEAMVTWFKAAHEAAGENVPLYLNENNVLNGKRLDSFERYARFLIERGAPIGGLGEQGHGGAMPIQELLNNLERLSKLKLPIKITEFDITTPDEELQADWTRDYLTVMFSHPSTVGFIMWGFWDGAHWLGDSPIFYQDWTLKPSGKAYMNLVLTEWWTNVNGKTDVQGSYKTRGFHGDYEVTVTMGGKIKTVKTELPKQGKALDIALN